MTDIAIVGCAGFLGSNLSNYLVQHTRYQISGVDNLSTYPDMFNLQFAFNSKARFEFYLANAHDSQIIGKFFEIEKPKVILYNILTAHLNLIKAGRDPKLMLETLRLWLDFAYLHGVTKFILFGGPTAQLTDIEVVFLKEAYLLLMSYQSKFKTIMLNYGELFGTRQRANVGVAKVIVNKLSGLDEKLVLDSNPKDLIYVKDMFSNVLFFIEEDVDSTAYSVNNKCGLSEIDLESIVNYIIEGKEPPDIQVYKDYSCHLPFNSNKLEWSAKYDILPAIEHTIAWYDQNKWSWR